MALKTIIGENLTLKVYRAINAPYHQIIKEKLVKKR